MSSIHWFEIPVADFERAKTFYETVMDIQINWQDLRETVSSIIGMLYGGDGVSGALVHNPQYGYIPSRDGTLVYLTVSGDLNVVLARVGDAGGEVVLSKTALGEGVGGGYIGWVIDSEGNKAGFFSEE